MIFIAAQGSQRCDITPEVKILTLLVDRLVGRQTPDKIENPCRKTTFLSNDVKGNLELHTSK